MRRRVFFSGAAGVAALAQSASSQQRQPSPAPGGVFLERPAAGQPHKGKVLLAIQPHSDDIPLSAAGTVAKLIQEGYTGYMIRGTNDDMGDAPGLGMPGTIGENVLRNESDNLEICRVLGLKGSFDLNYSNHRMADVSINELICRLILIIRCLKVDTVIAHDPWAHDEENPDHYTLARGVEAACWMAGRAHDYPEQFAAGVKPYSVRDKYYYARQPNITRVVDISGVIDKKIEANRANAAKGPAGHLGSKLRTDLAKKGVRVPLLGDDDATADRNYIREFQLTRNRELGKQYGVEYAEAFHYIGGSGGGGNSRIDNYVKQYGVPLNRRVVHQGIAMSFGYGRYFPLRVWVPSQYIPPTGCLTWLSYNMRGLALNRRIEYFDHMGLELRTAIRLSLLLLLFTFAFGAADRVLWDFESGTFAGWKVEGKAAFGEAPFDASEVPTWAKDRQFRGYQGKYMIIVGDTRHGNTPPGRLVSDEFEITHNYLKFLYGGEVNPEVRVYLTVGGKEVRTACGNNSYDMRMRGWDVREFKGRRARLVVQDTAEAPSLVRLDYFHLSDTPPPAIGDFPPNSQETSLVHYGEFRCIYDPGPGKYINYASILRGRDGKWHLYGTLAAYGDRYKPENHKTIIHATSASLSMPAWRQEEPAITADPQYGESLAWDPFVMESRGTYCMYYVGSGETWKGWDPTYDWRKKIFGTSTQGPYGIHLATSKDGYRWVRQSSKPLFTDFPFAFTPFVMRSGDRWVMYYAGVEPAAIMGKHGILTRTSKDLIHWDNRQVALIDLSDTTPWPEHSFFHDPFVFQRGKTWYLLAGPIDNGNQSRFHYRKLYPSSEPMQWDTRNTLQGLFLEGGSKIIRNTDGKDYTWYAGVYARGVWVAPLVWKQ